MSDVNGDGIPDIITANGYAGNQALAGGKGVSVMLGKGDGTFQPPLDTATGGATSLVASDFNGDGKLDLAITTGSNGMVLLGRGDGTFAISYTTTALHSSMVLAADLNGDGKLDLLFSGTTGSVKLGNGDGTFRDGQANLQAFANIYATVGDFNGDGRLDLAIRYRFEAGAPPIGAIMLGMPDGTFGPQFFTNFNAGLTNIVTADFNGDGILDTGGPGGLNGNSGITLGNGDGTFRFGAAGFGVHPFNTTPGVIQFPSFAAVGDFDSNGAPDMVVAEGNTIEVALNTGGHPPLLAQVTLTTAAGPATFVVGGATTVTGQVALGGDGGCCGLDACDDLRL